MNNFKNIAIFDIKRLADFFKKIIGVDEISCIESPIRPTKKAID